MPTLKSRLEVGESRRGGQQSDLWAKQTAAASPWPLRSHQTTATGRGAAPTAGSAPENGLQRPARANSVQRGREEAGAAASTPPTPQAEMSGRQSSPRRGVHGHLPLCWEGLHPPGKPGAERLRGPETPGQPPPSMRSGPAPRPWLQSGRGQSCQQGRSPRSWGGCTSRSGRCPAGS